MVREMIPIIKGVRQMYQTDTKSRFLPENSSRRVKNQGIFLMGEERFDEHVDITDHESVDIYLAFLFYLNDNDGVTHFTRQGVTIKPEDW